MIIEHNKYMFYFECHSCSLKKSLQFMTHLKSPGDWRKAFFGSLFSTGQQKLVTSCSDLGKLFSGDYFFVFNFDLPLIFFISFIHVLLFCLFLKMSFVMRLLFQCVTFRLFKLPYIYVTDYFRRSEFKVFCHFLCQVRFCFVFCWVVVLIPIINRQKQSNIFLLIFFLFR